ncbi:MAG: ClC family H(+)/Cl(-) exchange transporter [Mogibacterium sp.]|nr:ClC family H(+)/Cl(-) exchange transporter [Mogibacterium sp.]
MKESAAANLRRRDKFKYKLVVEGVFIGLITGVLVSVFRLMLTNADALRDRLVTFVNGGSGSISGVAAIVIGVVVMLLITAAVSWLLGAEPDIAGSGIPQVEAELKGQKDMCWWRVIAAKMAGCALAIGGGLALGREGPSIQLGSMVGKGFARAGHRLLTEERLLITCGAGAGLSAAFGAPLAGAIFSLEELHRNFSAEVLLSTMAASAASDFVAANIFGLTPVFGFNVGHGIPLRHYWAVVIVGVAVGLFGILYNRTIAFMQDLFDRAGKEAARLAGRLTGKAAFNLTDKHFNVFGEKASRTGRLLIMFAAAYMFMFVYPEVLGSGSSLVGKVSSGSFTLSALVILLIVKFLFSTASFGSGSPGGIFLPLLVLGAVTGGLVCRILGLFGFGQYYITALVVVAMAGYFSAIVRAPVTGVILITEMTGDFTCLLPLVLSSLVAYLIAEYAGVEPIYNQLLHRSKKRSVEGRRRSLLMRDRKTIIEADVHTGSYMDGRNVRDFGLPVGTLIISVVRDGVEIIPDGHTILRGGDELEILMREGDIDDVESMIEKRCRTVAE